MIHKADDYVNARLASVIVRTNVGHRIHEYSGTSLKGLSELRTQYNKPPY